MGQLTLIIEFKDQNSGQLGKIRVISKKLDKATKLVGMKKIQSVNWSQMIAETCQIAFS